MGLLDRFRKKERLNEKERSNEIEISKDEAEKRAKNILKQEYLYVILSTRQADYRQGVSIPYVCQIPENGKKGILLFSKEDDARTYIDQHQFEVLDGVYPIGQIKTNDNLRGLESIVSIANVMKIDFMDYNPGVGKGSIGCSIPWFIALNQFSTEISILMSQDEFKRTTAENEQVPLRFNPIRIYHYDDSYDIDADRSKSILLHIFECENREKAFQVFARETLFECCHTADYLCTMMIPKAQKEGKAEDEQYFRSVLRVLNLVIVGKLGSQPHLYTLIDPETKQIVKKNDTGYILYTDRFKYMGKYEYRELPQEKGLLWLQEESGTNQFMVTDGPHGMALIQLDK